jgi:cation:H+ antiporter
MPPLLDHPVAHGLYLLIGLVILVKGSDWFVESSASIARHFRIPDIIIGLTLVSIGTSLPELGTNIYAAITDQGEIVMGNVLGSNIANILLVLGVGVVMMKSMPVSPVIFKRDITIMLITYGVLMIFFFTPDGLKNIKYSRVEGAILFAGFIAYMWHLFSHDRHGDNKPAKIETHIPKTSAILIIGLVCVFGGSKIIVDNVVWLAKWRSIPSEIISATVIAFGTSVPELAVTITGIRQGKQDIAVGNIVGSCIFNILLVLAVSILTREVLVNREVIIMGSLMTATGILFAIFARTKWTLRRYEGIIMVSCYALFIAWSVFQVLHQSDLPSH